MYEINSKPKELQFILMLGIRALTEGIKKAGMHVREGFSFYYCIIYFIIFIFILLFLYLFYYFYIYFIIIIYFYYLFYCIYYKWR